MTNFDTSAIVPVPADPTSTNPNTVPVGGRIAGLSLFGVDQQLSLANGMTAGYGVNDGVTENPPAAPGTYGGNPLYQPNRVGFIRNVAGSLPSNNPNNPNATPQYTLYFMFNPNQITSQFSANLNASAPLYMYGTGGGAQNSSADAITSLQQQGAGPSVTVPNLVSTQSLSFSLFFDRTYDMLYGANGGQGKPEDDRGVLKDVAALLNLMGTFETQAAVPFSTPCEVVFGQNAAGQLWGFTGYILGTTITYGIFRHDMFPSRCEIDITFQCSYTAQSTPSNAQSSASTATSGTTASGASTLPSSSILSTVTGPPLT
jgi:hypothetical protein